MRHLPVALALAGALAVTGCASFSSYNTPTLRSDLDKVEADTAALVIDAQERPVDPVRIAADLVAAKNDWATLIADYKAAGKSPPPMPHSLVGLVG